MLGVQAWSVQRAKGKQIPSGGTLVIGREQDCPGGCFDSYAGAAGGVQSRSQIEYGAQDFIGVIDEIRIWRTVRTQTQIEQVRFLSLLLPYISLQFLTVPLTSLCILTVPYSPLITGCSFPLPFERAADR